jgi:phage terminase large subunit-like protein
MSAYSRIADAIESDWRARARPEQLLPSGKWVVWLYLGGRGTGKTRSGAEGVKERVESGQARRIGLIGPTAADVRDTMLEGPSGLLSIYPDSERPVFEASKRRVTFANGAIATLFSAEEPDRLRGPNTDLLWADELAAWKDAEIVWKMAMLGLRIGRKPQAIVTTTPRPIPIIKKLLTDPNTIVTRGTTYDNRANLAASFFDQIIKAYEGTRFGRQELNAEILDDVPGALWTRAMIDAHRLASGASVDCERIVIAVDPAVSVGENSDETGIVVVGMGFDGRFYVFEDASGKFAPIEWARRVVALYRRWMADRVVVEVNQGGDMVEATIRMVDRSVAIRRVHAKRGKMVRAEPVSALYEQGRVSHGGAFETLEDQMCSFAPGATDSPDRVDALVYALTDLVVRPRPVLHFG